MVPPWAYCADFTEPLQLEAQGALQLSDGWISWGLEFKFSLGNGFAAFMLPGAAWWSLGEEEGSWGQKGIALSSWLQMHRSEKQEEQLGRHDLNSGMIRGWGWVAGGAVLCYSKWHRKRKCVCSPVSYPKAWVTLKRWRLCVWFPLIQPTDSYNFVHSLLPA